MQASNAIVHSAWAPGRGPIGRARRRGYSLLELLVVLGIILVLIGLALPVIRSARAAERNLVCLTNLRSIGIAFSLYMTDSNQRFPAPLGPWEQSISPYLDGANVFRCPADYEIYPGLGSSYDWRDTGKPQTTLFGRSRAEIGRADLVLAFESMPSWHNKHRINVVTIEGSARAMDQEECFQNLDLPIAP